MSRTRNAIKTGAASAGWTGAEGRFGLKSAPPDAVSVGGLRRRQLPATILALGSVAGVAPAWAQRAGTPAQAAAHARTITWAQADPVLAARHQRALAGLSNRIDAQLTDVQSVVALHRGHLAFEYYRQGVTADTLQDTQSVTKSVLGLLFGCALADGLVRGTDELIATRLPAMLRQGADPRVQRLRFEHLLTMTAGWPGDQTAQRDRDDDLRQIVRRPFKADPGQRFAYDNGTANLLALALANVARQPLSAYARQRLLQPLGIDRFSWRQGAQGHDLGALGLSLTTRGMARVGELVLAEGRWEGRALLPADYLRRATTARNNGGDPLFSPYGYLWWVAGKGREQGAVFANGYGGQWIYVYPPLQLVVAATSRRTPESMARGQAGSFIKGRLIPALRRI